MNALSWSVAIPSFGCPESLNLKWILAVAFSWAGTKEINEEFEWTPDEVAEGKRIVAEVRAVAKAIRKHIDAGGDNSPSARKRVAERALREHRDRIRARSQKGGLRHG